MTSKAIVFAASLMFLLPGAMGVMAGTGESKPVRAIRLYLNAGTFDPLTESPPVPEALRADRAGDYRILQFTGPVLDAWKQKVAALGAVLFGYLPDYAFIARMDEQQENAVRSLSFVRWTGAYQPGYKLHPALASERGVMTMNVMFFDDPDGLEARLCGMGLDVLWRDSLGIRILADVTIAPVLAFIP